MDFLIKRDSLILIMNSPFLIIILSLLALFVIMNICITVTNKRIRIEELTSSVFIVKYESRKFFHYGIIYCVTPKGQHITLIDPGFVFRDHIRKITPRELNDIKFCIEFKWRLLLMLDIKIMELETKSMGLKTER